MCPKKFSKVVDTVTPRHFRKTDNTGVFAVLEDWRSLDSDRFVWALDSRYLRHGVSFALEMVL